MKIWEILKEANVGRKVKVSNQNDFVRFYGYEYYEIGKNGLGKIGIFAKNYKGIRFVEDIQSTDILNLNFEFIE